MRAINLKLLIIGLLGLTGCKTETITESSFWQMLPFTERKPTPVANKAVPAEAKPTIVTTSVKAATTSTKPPAVAVTPATPSPGVTPPAASTKKAKKAPPAAAISLPITPSKKSQNASVNNPETTSTPSTGTDSTTLTPSAQPLRFSDWIYDEKAHEQWRQKQLEDAQEKGPVHQFESAQLNRAFYNIILNEPNTTTTTDAP